MITSVRHDYPEKSGFTINRPNGHKEYTFLHFLTPVDIDTDGKIQRVKPGGCIIFAPGVPQWVKSHCNLLHNWFHADHSLKKLLDETNIPQNRIFYPADAKFISAFLQRTEAEFFSQSRHREMMLNAMLTEFLCLLSRSINDPPALRVISSNQDKMRALRQKILAEPEAHLSVKEMARFAGLSPSRFHGVYKSVFGTSPVKDSISARVDYAKTLLLNRDMPIYAIAEKLGYNDQYHFIRQFKKETGLTPAAFRRK